MHSNCEVHKKSNSSSNRLSVLPGQLSSLGAPTLWFMDLTVVTCHILYIFLRGERANSAFLVSTNPTNIPLWKGLQF